MRFTHTLAAARSQAETTWAVADGLEQDFSEANVKPTILHFKEAAEELEAAGYTYNPKTLADYWRVAATFTTSHRKSGVPLTIYLPIVDKLWGRLDPETRTGDLISMTRQFFAEHPKKPAARNKAGEGAWSFRAAQAWASSQAAGLDAERKAREEEAAKDAAKKRLAHNEANLAKAIAEEDWDRAEDELDAVNMDRKRLGMELLKLDRKEAAVETDEEATEEAKAEAEEATAERLHLEAKTEIEYGIARIGNAISYLGNAFLRVSSGLNADDLDAYHEEIEMEKGRLDLIQARFGGTASDEALAAALAKWESEATRDEGR